VSSSSPQLDARVRALEVEAIGDLLVGLLDRVPDFLPVDLGNDVEGGQSALSVSRAAIAGAARHRQVFHRRRAPDRLRIKGHQVDELVGMSLRTGRPRLLAAS